MMLKQEIQTQQYLPEKQIHMSLQQKDPLILPAIFK